MCMQTHEIDEFLNQMNELENQICSLIRNSQLSESQQSFILKHILVIPGNESDKLQL